MVNCLQHGSGWLANGFGRSGNCYDMIKDCIARGINEICAYADNFCYNQVEYPYDVVTGRDEYDVRYLTPDPFPPTFYVDYLNTPAVQQAIGAYVNYTESSSAVGAAFASTGDDARIFTSVNDMSLLLSQNVSVTMYFGDADYVCNWIGGEAVSYNVGASGYSDAGFTNISTSDGVVHGQVKQAGTFSFVRIYESGHEVPFYQPVVALEMFERVLGDVDIATGHVNAVAGYKTEGTAKSEYRNGNGTMQFEVLPQNATYNTMLNAPDPMPPTKSMARRRSHGNTRRHGRR